MKWKDIPSIALVFYLLPSPTPTNAPVRIMSLPTATPTAATIRYIPLPSPTPTAAPPFHPPVIKLIPTSSTAPYIQVSDPAAGATFELNGAGGNVNFSYGNLDTSKNGQYVYQAELWHNGTKLGVLENINPFQLNAAVSQSSLSYQTGKYIDADNTEKVAGPDSGYSIKIIIYLSGNPVASGASGGFTYTAGNQALNPTVGFASPAGGETLPLDASTEQIVFTQSGFDPYKDGVYKYSMYLQQNGTSLGKVESVSPYSLNTKTPQNVLSVMVGRYIDSSNNFVVAKPGSGYTYKLYVTDSGSAVASATSPAFSFVSVANKTGSPVITVTSPNGGENLSTKAGASSDIIFTQKNFDPYQNGNVVYSVYLYRNGKRLGRLASAQPYSLNLSNPTADLHFDATRYIDDSFAYQTPPSGSGYKVQVIVTAPGNITISDMSDGFFSYNGNALDVIEGTVSKWLGFFHINI